MPDSIATAAIVAVATVVGASISSSVPTLLTRADDGKRFRRSDRANAIVGTWVGTGRDFYTEDASEFFSFDLKMTLSFKGAKVVGTGELDDTPAALAVDGGFVSESYVQMRYKSVDPTRMQMGVIMFRLSANGRELEGHYAGYSPVRQLFVAGSVKLVRMLR